MLKANGCMLANRKRICFLHPSMGLGVAVLSMFGPGSVSSNAFARLLLKAGRPSAVTRKLR